jgi:Cu(I)/Ag(I) efflux system membrane fusion protein
MPGMDMPRDKKSNVNPVPAAKPTLPASETMDKSMTPMIESDIFAVSGNCDLCKERIEKAAKSVGGVTSAVWDTKTHKIKVEFDSMKTDLITIQKAIAKAGHDTGKFKADNKTYEALPECCHYR